MDIYTANKLLQLRKANNLSQEELAERLNISRQAVSKWERAESSPDTDNLIALAKLYRISLDELLEVDVKTFVQPESSRKIISLKKESDFSQPEHDDGEIYPQDFKTPEPDDIPHVQPDTENFNAGNYAVPPVKPSVNIVNPVHSSRFKDFDYDRINFKILYTFPYYAIAAIMFFLGIDCHIRISGCSISDISYLWWLTIPLYYTAVAAIQKKNANCFCYPVLAVILFLLMIHITGDPVSLIMFATIPFYYFFVYVKRHKNKR